MIMKTATLVSILCAGLLTTMPSAASAAPINFHVQFNTTALIGSPLAPFYLDLALTDGSGTLAGPNTVTITNFLYGGGSPPAAPFITGTASGNIGSTVTLADTPNFFNELYQR